MRRILFIILAVFLFSYAAFSATVTVNSVTANWSYGGTTARLKIYADVKFQTAGGAIVLPGQAGLGNVYKEIVCTVSGNTLTIPSFQIDSTTDSTVTAATYTFILFDFKNVRRDTFADRYRLPHTFGSTVSWTQLATYNRTPARPAVPGSYTDADVNLLIQNLTTVNEVTDMVTLATSTLSSGQTTQVNSLIGSAAGLSPNQTTSVNTIVSSAIAGKVDTTDTRIEKNLSLYSNSLATAVSTICPSGTCATPTILNISRPVTVSSNLTAPKGLTLNVTGEGKITLAASAVLTVNNFVDPGSRQVFDSSASGAKVLFTKGAVEKIKIAWWVGNTSGANVTDALNEALESANATQIPIHLSQGIWYTSGALTTISKGVTIEGEGNHVTPDTGTSLWLQSPSSNYLFKISGSTYGVRFKDINLTGNGTTGQTGILLQGTAPATSGDLSLNNVSIDSFAIGLYHDSTDSMWQFAQIKIDQSRFYYNTVGIKTDSSNSQFTILSTNFYSQNNQTAIQFDGVGETLITGCEFAGPGVGATNAKILVINGAHAVISLRDNQDEGYNTFLENNASDLTSIVNLSGNTIQSQLYINQAMTLVSTGNKYGADTVRVAPGVIIHATSINDSVLMTFGTLEDPATIPANPLRIFKTTNPTTQFEFNPILATASNNYRGGGLKIRHYADFSTPSYFDGIPSEPVVAIGAATANTETKNLLRLGRRNSSTQDFDYYYDFARQNSGTYAGRLTLSGNQTGFVGLDFNGDIYASGGAVRGQSCQLTDAATITIIPSCGNNQYFTLGGNRTLAAPVMAASDKTRADGQRISLEIIQDATGSRTLSLSSGAGQFAFGTDITSVTMTTTANKRDILTVQYSSRLDRWMVIDFKRGF